MLLVSLCILRTVLPICFPFVFATAWEQSHIGMCTNAIHFKNANVMDIMASHDLISTTQAESTRRDERWSSHCTQNCLHTRPLMLASTSIKSPDSKSQVNIPPEYAEYQEVFSKTKAGRLPPYRTYDCAIELLRGTSPPRGRIYASSLLEQKAMEEYVAEALKRGYIVLSTSPA